MEYNKIITLKDGRECVLRNGTEQDAQQELLVFIETHKETDFLRTYPDEITYTVKEQGEFLREKTESEREIEIVAELGGRLVGSAGIDSLGSCYKTRHRADFGISILKDYWGLGIGTAMINACIECAKKAGYTQLELSAVAENEIGVRIFMEKFQCFFNTIKIPFVILIGNKD